MTTIGIRWNEQNQGSECCSSRQLSNVTKSENKAVILTAKHFYRNGMVGISKLKTTNLHHIHTHTNPEKEM